MSIKTATPDLRNRIRRASANIAAGVRLSKPDLELEGRRLSATAHIENQILLGRAFLSKEDAERLSEMLFSTNPVDAVEAGSEPLVKHSTLHDDEDLEGDEL